MMGKTLLENITLTLLVNKVTRLPLMFDAFQIQHIYRELNLEGDKMAWVTLGLQDRKLLT